jgi:hypothetical protein
VYKIRIKKLKNSITSLNWENNFKERAGKDYIS